MIRNQFTGMICNVKSSLNYLSPVLSIFIVKLTTPVSSLVTSLSISSTNSTESFLFIHTTHPFHRYRIQKVLVVKVLHLPTPINRYISSASMSIPEVSFFFSFPYLRFILFCFFLTFRVCICAF